MGIAVKALTGTMVLLLGCGSGGATGDAGSDDDASDAQTEAAIDGAGDADVDAPPPHLTCSSETNEPNDKEVLASFLGTIDDCDGSGSTFSSVSSGTNDADWFRFRGTDTFGCSVDPTITMHASGLRACAFALCVDGATEVQSCTNGTSATSPAGTNGCCTNGTSAMTLQINCTGVDDSADIFVRVDQPGSDQCVSYDVDYHF